MVLRNRSPTRRHCGQSPAYDGSEGNPAGSVYWILSNHTASDGSAKISKTFAEWGVPATAVISAVTNLSGDVKLAFTGSAANAWPGVGLQTASGVVQYLYPASATSSDFPWGAVTPLQIDNDQSPYALTDSLDLLLDIYGSAVSGTLEYWYDNISFDIEYTIPGVDVESSAAGSQRNQQGAGTLTITDVDCRLTGDGSQRRQQAPEHYPSLMLCLYGDGSQRRQQGAGTLTFVDVDCRIAGDGSSDGRQVLAGYRWTI